MIKPINLFFQRVLSEYKFNLKLIRRVVDWTVALYIVIPWMGFMIYKYLEWMEKAPGFFEVLPFSILYVVLALFCWRGNVRLFLKDADRIFLVSRKKWTDEIMMAGIAYTLAVDLLATMAIFIFLLPFTDYHSIEGEKLIILAAITWLAKICFNFIKQFISIKFDGWSHFFINKLSLLLAAGAFAYMASRSLESNLLAGIAVAALLGIDSFFITRRLRLKGAFFKDVERGKEEHCKYVAMFMSLSGVVNARAKKYKKKPLLFYKSQLIFRKRTKENALAEVAIKATLRKSKEILLYLQILVVSTLIVLAVPLGIKLYVWLAMAFILTGFFSFCFREIFSVAFIQLFPWDLVTRQRATVKYSVWMNTPGFCILTLAAALQIDFSYKVLWSIPIAVATIYVITAMVAGTSVLRKKI